MDYEYLAHQDSWEQARLVAYLIAQSNSKNKLQLTDIVKFYWEKDIAESESTTAISNADVDRLKNLAKQYTESIKKK